MDKPTTMDRIIRDRKTEERIRAMDATEIVDEIHSLEDRLEAAETINHNQKLVIELAAERLEESEANAALNRAMEVTERERADKAEALIKEIGELLVSLKRRRPPASQCIDELQAKLKEYGHG